MSPYTLHQTTHRSWPDVLKELRLYTLNYELTRAQQTLAHRERAHREIHDLMTQALHGTFRQLATVGRLSITPSYTAVAAAKRDLLHNHALTLRVLLDTLERTP